jgi:hypothetical protein
MGRSGGQSTAKPSETPSQSRLFRTPTKSRGSAIESESSAQRKEIAMDELPTATQEQVIGALGRAIVKLWSQLPHDIQQHLFEEAVRSEDKSVRQQIAVFLHHRHPRTSDPIKARAIPEPDSLGG